jgi:hypothetical protein
MNQKPVAIALLLCEQVIIEESTRNVTPINCFTRRRVGGSPVELFPFVAFAILTDGLGEVPLELRIERLDTFEAVFRRVLSYRFNDPLQTIRCIVRVRDFAFPEPGEYQLSLLTEDETLAQCKLVILEKEKLT